MKCCLHTIRYQKVNNSCCKKWCNRQNNISNFLSNCNILVRTKPIWIWKEIIHPCCFNDFLFLCSRCLHLLWFAYDVWIYEIIVSFYIILLNRVSLDTFYFWYFSNYRNKMCFGMLHFYCFIENNRNIFKLLFGK